MKYKLVLDKNNYLRSIEKSYSEDGYELDIFKMNLDFKKFIDISDLKTYNINVDNKTRRCTYGCTI